MVLGRRDGWPSGGPGRPAGPGAAAPHQETSSAEFIHGRTALGLRRERAGTPGLGLNHAVVIGAAPVPSPTVPEGRYGQAGRPGPRTAGKNRRRPRGPCRETVAWGPGTRGKRSALRTRCALVEAPRRYGRPPGRGSRPARPKKKQGGRGRPGPGRWPDVDPVDGDRPAASKGDPADGPVFFELLIRGRGRLVPGPRC